MDDELVTFDDGFAYYWPRGCNGGFSSNNLREIAYKLDEINAPWLNQIDEYFNEQKQLTIAPHENGHLKNYLKVAIFYYAREGSCYLMF